MTSPAPALVDGPAWVTAGVDESSGLYPLRVEPAVFRLVDRLLPGVITTTTQARYYALHALAWSEAQDADMAPTAAEAFVRRCEVVMAAAFRACRDYSGVHVAGLPAAHGEQSLPSFTSGGVLDVAAASALGGFSKGGLAETYRRAEQVMRLLAAGDPPRRGPRADLDRLRAGLGDVIAVARQDVLTSEEQLQLQHLCPCRIAATPDGAWLRSVMFEEADPEVEGDRNRQMACSMLLYALAKHGGAADVERAFRLVHGFGDPIVGDDRDASIRRGWRAAILRNYSVSAWRRLWCWVSRQLAVEELTIAQLTARLVHSTGTGTVRSLLGELPERVSRDRLLPAEERLDESDEALPRRAIKQLALGAQRLDDLDQETCAMFLGRDRHDLGPAWVRHQVDEHMDDAVATIAADLLDVMLRRARRVAYSK